MAFPEKPRLAALLGWPLSHSRSALMHRIWAEREGVNAHYVPIAVEPGFEPFARAADSLKALGFAGCNITIPHKQNALLYATSASKAASEAGAANMLTFGKDGAYADNADIAGFAASLQQVLSRADWGGHAVVLGAGGAARAVIVALKGLGYRAFTVVNRSEERAKEVAKALGAGAASWESRHDLVSSADLLVNATSLGMKGEPPLDIRLEGMPASAIVADVVANPVETALLAAAKARGLRTADGLTMLMHQAVPAYKAWLGKEAVVDADLRARLEAAIGGGR